MIKLRVLELLINPINPIEQNASPIIRMGSNCLLITFEIDKCHKNKALLKTKIVSNDNRPNLSNLLNVLFKVLINIVE